MLGIFYVPDSRDPDESALDPIGALLSIVTLGLIMFGIIEAPDLGWGDPQVIAAIGVGLLFLGVFIWWELHNDHAMLDLRFFKNPRFSAASATITLTYFALFGSTFLLTQYFQFVLGYSPLKAGLMTAPVAIGIMGFAPQAPKFVDRFGTKRVVVTGLLIVAISLCFYAIRHGDVVVLRRHLGPHHVRRRDGAHDRSRHRVDHGVTASRPRRASAPR